MFQRMRSAFLVLLWSFAAAGAAQEEPPKGLIDVDLMAPVFGKATLEYEAVLGPAASVVFGPQLDFSREPFLAGARPFSGYGLSLGLHVFPWGGATRGFWLGPELTGGYLLDSTWSANP